MKNHTVGAAAEDERDEAETAEQKGRRDLMTLLGGLGAAAVLAGCENISPGAGTGVAPAGGALSGMTSIVWCDTLTEQLTIKGGAAAAAVNVCVRRGYALPGDGGGGVFVWVAALSPCPDDDLLGGLVVVPTGSATGYWRRLGREAVDVKWFGAKGDGIANDTAAIQAAVARSLAGNGTVFFSPGTYLVKAPITISNPGTQLLGAGRMQTKIQFDPTVAGSCFVFTSALAQAISRCSVARMDFISSTTIARCAIEAADVSDFEVRDVGVGVGVGVGAGVSPWAGTGSVGLRIRGREYVSVRGFAANCDIPLQISVNFHAGNRDLDHANFHDLTLTGTSTTLPCVLVDPTVATGPVSFTGNQTWVNGSGGLAWTGTSATPSQMWLIEKLLYKTTGPRAGAWAIKIDRRSGALGRLSLANFFAGNAADHNGIFLRNVGHVLTNCVFQGAAGSTGLDIDGSCCPAVHSRCVLNANQATINLKTVTTPPSAGALEVFATPMQSTLQPPFVLYDTDARPAQDRTVRILGHSVTYAAAPPTAGTWAPGDLCWNAQPVAGSPAGWSCVTGGTPGVWAPIPSCFAVNPAAFAPGPIAVGRVKTTAISVPGVVPGDKVLASWIGTLISNGVFVVANATAVDTVTFTVANLSPAPVDVPSGTPGLLVMK